MFGSKEGKRGRKKNLMKKRGEKKKNSFIEFDIRGDKIIFIISSLPSLYLIRRGGILIRI